MSSQTRRLIVSWALIAINLPIILQSLRDPEMLTFTGIALGVIGAAALIGSPVALAIWIGGRLASSGNVRLTR